MNYYSSGPVVIFPFLYLRAKLRTKKVRITCRNFVKWLRRRFAAIASGSGSAADATIGILWHPGVRCCCRCCCRCHCSVERSAKKEHIQCSFTPGFYKPMSRVRSITILVQKWEDTNSYSSWRILFLLLLLLETFVFLFFLSFTVVVVKRDGDCRFGPSPSPPQPTPQPPQKEEEETKEAIFTFFKVAER